MAGNQTDAKNAAKRALKTEEDALQSLRRNGGNSNQVRDQERRVADARNRHSAAEAAEREALRGSAKSWF